MARILFVEDDPMLREIMTEYLSHHQVVPLTDIEEACAFLERDPAFELIITDYHLQPFDFEARCYPPGRMTGPDLLTHVRCAGIGIPLVLMSSEVQNDTELALLISGFAGVIRKPPVWTEVLPLIDRLTRGDHDDQILLP